MSEIIYRIALTDDNDEILEILRQYYYPDEPITIGNKPIQQSPEDEAFSMRNIPYGTSVVAIDTKTNKIVGVCISGPIFPNDDLEMIEESKTTKDKKWQEILELFVYLEQKANVLQRFNVEKSLHMYAVGVNPAYRGNSIGLNLMKNVIENGKVKEYNLASVDCTNVFSIKIAEKLGMELVATTNFDEYLDENKQQVFCPPPPNNTIKSFVIRI